MAENNLESKDDKMAVLIDGDNAQASLLAKMLAEIAKHGSLTIRRIYGDWTTSTMHSWKDALHLHAVQPIQQFRYTVGKNATDSTLIIDAMDIMHRHLVEGFCIVSSDSDYTRLATRIREEGFFVMGIGQKKTPKSFVNADMLNAHYAGEYEIFLDRHSSFTIEVGSYTKSIYTEYRDYWYENGDPIYQNISLRIVPLEIGIKFYPTGHRHVVNPFIGVGAGIYAWTYQQWGDFIDFTDDSINEGFAETKRFNVGFNGRVGLVYRFQSRLALALEGKYTYLKGRLSDYFQDFDRLDLGGFTANAGINIFFR